MKKIKSYSRKRKITNIFVHLGLAVLAVIWVLPIFWQGRQHRGL